MLATLSDMKFLLLPFSPIIYWSPKATDGSLAKLQLSRALLILDESLPPLPLLDRPDLHGSSFSSSSIEMLD